MHFKGFKGTQEAAGPEAFTQTDYLMFGFQKHKTEFVY